MAVCCQQWGTRMRLFRPIVYRGTCFERELLKEAFIPSVLVTRRLFRTGDQAAKLAKMNEG